MLALFKEFPSFYATNWATLPKTFMEVVSDQHRQPATENAMLSHEKLEVYEVALEYFALATRHIERLPRGNRELKTQLDRASTSILLNIAEGAGRVRAKDKASFYTISRGSALECAAVYDALKLRHLVKPSECHHAKDLIGRVVSMLTKMIDL